MSTSPAFKDEPRLGTDSSSANSVTQTSTKPKFVTQAFGLAVRAMALGPISTLEQLNLISRQLSFMNRQENNESEEFKALEVTFFFLFCGESPQ